jgi:hypothetical protein
MLGALLIQQRAAQHGDGSECGEFEIPIISPRVRLGISNSKTALKSQVF